MGGGQRGGIQTNSNPKCQDLSKLSFGSGGGQLKSQVPRSFVCGWGGGGGGVVVQTNIPEILECGHSRNFTPKIVENTCIADSLSHTCAETNKKMKSGVQMNIQCLSFDLNYITNMKSATKIGVQYAVPISK